MSAVNLTSGENLPPLISMKGISKRFPGVLANDDVNLEVQPGEIHALLGENGAGKSTLMNILSGLYHPDAGEIRVDGKRINLRSTRDAIEAGIGMVHQHFSLVDVFSVIENVVIGLDLPGIKLDLQKVENTVLEMGENYGLRVDPQAKIWQLSVGEQQRVEIIKMLYRNARLLILDEPTAVLTPQEADELADILHEMAKSGRSVLYISHKLQEVLRVADRITIMRKGRKVATVNVEDVDEKELTRLMIGSEILPRVEKGPQPSPGKMVLDVREITVEGNRGYDSVQCLSLQIREGEILGLAGVAGNGQRELAEAIVGLRPVKSGRIEVDSEPITNLSPRAIINKGVSLIPENCIEMGLVPNLNLYENAILKNYKQPPISRGLFLDRLKIQNYAEELVQDYKIQMAAAEEPVWKMSGGNLQRLLLGREISNHPRILIAANPTRGLDIQAAMEIRKMLIEQRNQGAVILLISEDLDEILNIADRIAVMFAGNIIGIRDKGAADIEDIGLMMMGSLPSESGR
jgi:ABC-type uncharacterized transport system ATPase subunit